MPAREDIEAKKQIILRHGLALWDTLESCTIIGASDASIRDVVPNDIAGLLAKAPIEAVFCNGATAYKIYTKYLEPVSGIPAVRLPSTSPANAACRPEKLREIWQKELSNWILPWMPRGLTRSARGSPIKEAGAQAPERFDISISNL